MLCMATPVAASEADGTTAAETTTAETKAADVTPQDVDDLIAGIDLEEIDESPGCQSTGDITSPVAANPVTDNAHDFIAVFPNRIAVLVAGTL